MIAGLGFLRLPIGEAQAFRPGGRDGAALHLLPASVAGEFDTPLVDPAYRMWTSSNLAEAFPGPMTALSLELSLRATRASGTSFAAMLPIGGRLGEDTRRHLLASFGHTIYANVAILRETAALMGQSPEEFDRQIFGTALPPGYRRPKPSPSTLVSMVRAGVAMGPRVAALGRAVMEQQVLAQRRLGECAGLPQFDDEALHGAMERLADELCVAWTVANLATALVAQPMAAIEHRRGAEAALASRVGLDQLESAGAAHGVRLLAAAIAAEPRARAACSEPDVDALVQRMAADAPGVARVLEEVVRRHGHRGPGETELANPVYADQPGLLLRAAAGSLERDATASTHSPDGAPTDRMSRRLDRASQRRELARDAVVKLTHATRLVAREMGRRLTEGGRIAEPADVFHLRRDELRRPPPEAAELAVRRHEERRRLADLRLPVVLDGPWTPTAAPAPPLSTLSGVGASSGRVTGPVRVLRESPTDLAPGEILVARVTDVGWTPFFTVAGAVVTDAGGLMSHAAVVARELGIPAVVGTEHATTTLRDGQLVDVDGTTGRVTVLDSTGAAAATAPHRGS